MAGSCMLREEKSSSLLDSKQRDDSFGTRKCRRIELKVFGGDALQDFGHGATAVRRRRDRLQPGCSFGIRQLWNKRSQISGCRFPFAKEAVNGGANIVRGAFELSGHPGNEVGVFARGSFRSLAAEKFQAPVLANLGAATKEDRADLPGA